MNATTCDFLILGAGIMGLTIAREIHLRRPQAKIIILEKEELIGLHASGRNSGVLHAGFYYSPESLKARFTKEGNTLLTNYCIENGLKINRCGKLVVAVTENDLEIFPVILDRAKNNNISLELIDAKQAEELEPCVNTTMGHVLYSPTTSSVDPKEVLNCLFEELQKKNIIFKFNERFLDFSEGQIRSTKQTYSPGFIINCAGSYADKIAHRFGFGLNYKILPFKGRYLYSAAKPLRLHIYPVPNLQQPFLGVHFTVQANGEAKIGPTAMPALWREQYTAIKGFNLPEFTEIMYRNIGLCLHSNFGYGSLAVRELKKMIPTNLQKDAAHLVKKDFPISIFNKQGPSGIRAQLFDLSQKKLTMDFVVEGDERSMHVLNSVSPAFTCSFSFSRYLCDRICP